jgi:hypothetical protein
MGRVDGDVVGTFVATLAGYQPKTAVYDQVVSAELAESNQDPELLNWLANI